MAIAHQAEHDWTSPISQVRLIFLTIFFLGVSACGGGGGDTPPPQNQTQSVSGGGVKGPLANADVIVYAFAPSQPGFKGSVVATGTTDASAAISGLSLPLPLAPPYIMEFTSHAGTTDITTGQAPVISTLRTVLTQSLLNSGNPLYATPLTTMATDIAVLNADSNTAPYTGDNDGTVTETEYLNALTISAGQVISTLGFGMSSSLDIFSTPPLINATTNTSASQTAVAEYRSAVEALTAMMFQLGSGVSPPQSAEAMLIEFTNDLGTDGLIDGMINGSPSAIIDNTVLNTLTSTDPTTLPIPNSDDGTGSPILVGDIESLLVSEKSTTGSTTPTPDLENGSIDVSPQAAQTNPSQDGDTIPDSIDNCPNTANEDQGDSNGNGVGDACDMSPVAVADSLTVDEAGTIALLDGGASSVLTNDTDAEGDSLTAVLDTDVSNGSLTFNSDGTFSYTHDGSETTSDSFTYHANDGSSDSNTVTVTIAINPINDPPVAVTDSLTVDEGATTTLLDGGATSVLDNDTDAEGDTLTAVLVSDVSNGSLTLMNDGRLSYTHNGSETTSDSFTYHANDGSSDSNTVTVTIAINPINDPPVAIADSISAITGGTATQLDGGSTSVLDNDTDAEGDTLTAVLVSDVSNGSLTLNSDGSFSYTHDGGTTTTDSFVYRANDGAADSNNITVNITISANQSPVAVADSLTVDEAGTIALLDGGASSVLANDTDAEGDSLTAVLDTDVSNGSLTFNSDGTFSYTHNGSETTSDSFTYHANDGSSDSNTVTVTIAINPINDPPVAIADSISVTTGGTATQLDGGSTSVLDNDTDAEGDTLTAVLVSDVSNGFLTLNSDGSFSYTHDGGTSTTDSFSYMSNDGTDNSAPINVAIAISSGVDISGVWVIDTSVTAESPTGCAGGIGVTDQNVVTIAQTGNAVDIFTLDGAMLSGTINTATGDFTVSGNNSITEADLTQPTNDTAFVSLDDTISANGTGVSQTSLSASATTVEMENGVTVCTFSENVTGSFVYKHTGNEDYNGVYAFEISDESFQSDGSNFFERESIAIELELTSNNIIVHLPDDGPAAVNDSITFSNTSFDPSTGFFSFTIDEIERNDEDGDGTIDNSFAFQSEIRGIFMRDPALTNGIDGAPLVMWTENGYGRGYIGDVTAGGSPVDAENLEGLAYGKRLVTMASTRTILLERGDQTEESRILVGLLNAPLKRTDPNSTLYIEVLNNGGTLLCSIPYIFDGVNDGRYFEQVNMPHPDASQFNFRGDVYSSANCNTSNAGIDQVFDGDTLTVRVLDSGANGINENNSGDDVIIFSTTYAAEVVPGVERFTSTPKQFDISVNGVRSSITMSGSIVPIFGYFDLDEPIDITWQAHPGAVKYQLRAQGPAVDDFVKSRYPTTSTSITIPAGDLDDETNLRLNAINDATSNGAQANAFSRRLKMLRGIHGLFNIELGDGVPLDYQTFQVQLAGDGFGLSDCTVTNNPNLSCNPTSSSVDFINDIVTLSMTDSGSDLGGGSFDLLLHFKTTGVITSGDAIVTTLTNGLGIPTSVAGAQTHGRVANQELYVRSVRLSSGSTQTFVTLRNPFEQPLYDQVLFKVNDDSNIMTVPGGDTGSTTELIWDNSVAGEEFTNQISSFIGLPATDNQAQGTGRFVTKRTNTDWGLGNNQLLAANTYKAIVRDTSGVLDDLIFRRAHTTPDPSAYIAPTLGDLQVELGASTTNCATGTACDAGNPINILGFENSFNIVWTVPTPPANSNWRLVVTDVTTGDQIRTKRVIPAPGEEIEVITSGGGNTTYRWTNPGYVSVSQGQTIRIRIRVEDDASRNEYTVFGQSTQAHQVHLVR